ncbi:MAG: DUF4089 domain-containing protein [Rhodospirillaceae bacterium]|nr:DUF4089 domain-containing protein [Rhodospirillaceae bacterium]
MSTPPEFDAEAYLRTALPALGLTVPPEWMPAVIANFLRTGEIAAAFLDFPLDDREEPGPVFTP